MEELDKVKANYAALTPISFLKRAAVFYANRTSIIYGDSNSNNNTNTNTKTKCVRFTWRQTYHRCLRLAAALRSTALGIRKNDVVSVLAPNIPALYEMHFAVPMAGAVLNTINTRLNPNSIKTILAHSSAKLFFVDYQYLPVANEALRLLAADHEHLIRMNNPLLELELVLPRLIVIDDDYHDLLPSCSSSNYSYKFTKQHDPNPKSNPTYEDLIVLHFDDVDNIPNNNNKHKLDDVDEWDPISLNYTSGTTSAPKGVVYSHRGAYLCTLSMIMAWEMGPEPVYLWTLPMFHCNGWTFTWGIAARGGTNVCLRTTTATEIYRCIDQHKVTHMCCAPVVFNILLLEEDYYHPRRGPPPPPHHHHHHSTTTTSTTTRVQILTGGAPPPPALLAKIETLGFHVVHAYGLTEATGPALVCEWKKEWNKLPARDQANLKARQGIGIVTMAEVDVKNPTTLESVPHDGKTVGEIVLRGSGIMKGYLKDTEATREAFRDGWFWTGDVGVVHEDGYLEIKDRSKDVIISGGENISSVEVESVLFSHQGVSEAAVVAMPHPKWGESPCAFVVMLQTQTHKFNEEEIMSYCRSKMPHYMVPKKVVFMKELPKTSTGKVQKGKLREIAKAFQLMPDDHVQLKAPPRLLLSSRI